MILIGKDGCPDCERLKKILDKLGVDVTMINGEKIMT